MSEEDLGTKIAEVSQRLANARREQKQSREQAEAHSSKAEMLGRCIARFETELRELAQEYVK